MSGNPENDKFEGCIIITGGTKGIGLATAEEMVRLGYRNFILGYHRSDSAAAGAKDLLEKTEGVKAVLVKGDISQELTVDAIFTAVEGFSGSLYAIAHTAGLYLPEEGVHPETTFEKYQNIYSKALWRLVEKGVPYMEKSGRGGRVISLSTPGCNLMSSPRDFYFLPGCAKASMEYIIRHYAMTLAPKQITCNVVIPGITDTGAWTEDPHKLAKEWCPMEKIIPPSDVGAAVGFLLSERAKFITGAILPVDGGLMFVS